MNRRSLDEGLRIGRTVGAGIGLLLTLLWLLNLPHGTTTLASTPATTTLQAARAPVGITQTMTTSPAKVPITQSGVPQSPVAQMAAAQSTAAQLANETAQQWRRWYELSPMLQAKVDAQILAELRGDRIPAHLGGEQTQAAVQAPKPNPLAATRFFVYLHEQPELSQLESMVFASQVTARAALLQTLRDTASTQQAALRTFLDQRLQAATVQSYQPFFIVNAIAVEGGLDLVVELAQRPDVAQLVANYALVGPTVDNGAAQKTVATAPVAEAQADQDITVFNWNIALVRAHEVWQELGVRGEGAVVAGFDTGVYFRHPALLAQYRGNLGNNQFDHNYNWFEPDGNLYPNGDLGPSVSSEPNSCSNHGTHTMGTMVGNGGTTATQVGMAPAAQWIALPGICSNTMSGGLRDDIGGIKAFQWVLCPTDLTGDLDSADCAKAPDVVNNSWGSANPAAELFRPIIRMLRTANIAPVFAAGNPYANSGSIGTPANAPEAITVGATDRYDAIASFSGRGPSFYPGEQKPELSAPGVEVNSSVGSFGYSESSGTSMAAPHVAGLIALMVSADLQDGRRDLTVDEIEAFLIRTAVDLGPAGPDHSFGHGRIDAYAAIRAVLNAGDLRGAIQDATTQLPLDSVQVIGQSGLARFAVMTGAEGLYSLTVPAGNYDLTVAAWGYERRRFSGQPVVEGTASIADFALQPLPVVATVGTIQDENGPVPGAVVYVAAAPTVRAETDTNGDYALTLPTGEHTLVVEKAGYRIYTELVTVSAPGPLQRNLTLAAAPKLLLVAADVYRGWFDGWPIDLFFRTALEEHNYLYDFWPIQYTDQEDSFVREDGSTGYGLPSLATLAQYDTVIWAQSGCSSSSSGCFFSNGPSVMGTKSALEAYLAGGGRIIFSGQDFGFWEDGGSLFTDYLHTTTLHDDVAGEGDGLTGLAFLDNLHLTVTNASLYGYRNGIITLAPDAIAAESPLAAPDEERLDAYGVNVFPILRYNDTQQPAAIAVDGCAADYRAIYFGVGYENIAQRGEYRSADIAETLNRSVEWVNGKRNPLAVGVAAVEPLRFAPPGAVATHELRVANSGSEPVVVSVALPPSEWPVTLYRNGKSLQGLLLLAPCEAVVIDVQVAVPAAALDGARAQFTMTVSARNGDSINAPAEVGQQVVFEEIGLATAAFAEWEAATAMPVPRYQLGATTLATPATASVSFYTIGGWQTSLPDDFFEYERAMTDNLRFNLCADRWEVRAPLPAARAGSAVAALGNQIYVIGGGNQRVTLYRYESVETHADVWRYNPNDDSWSAVAPLPLPLVGAAAAALHGKLYVFGGMTFGYTLEDFGFGRFTANLANRVTYIYDPATDMWTTGAENPDVGHFFGGAAVVGEEIMVAGGWPDMSTVHFYQPTTNRWRIGPPLAQGRHSFGLVTAADDGVVYAVGGAIDETGIRTVERYVPAHSRWETLPMLIDDGRYGAVAGYANGHLMAVGGATAAVNSETLALADSFCRSTFQVRARAVGLNEPIYYAIELQGDQADLPNAGFSHRLPVGTRFGGFTANPLGATYNAAQHTVVWRGLVAAGQQLPPIEYEITAADTLQRSLNNARAAADQAFAPGTVLSSTVTFDNGEGLAFTRSARAILLATDIDGSQKQVSQRQIRSGEPVTYTITIQGNNVINRSVTLRDPLPAPLTYVPDSLRASTGEARYNGATNTITWDGRTSSTAGAVVNLTDDYLWGESSAPEAVGGIAYEWIEIEQSGTPVGNGDWNYYCNLPVGFPFPFYDQVEERFCVSTNGFISFDTFGHSGDLYNSCPMPSYEDNHSVIAAIWDDLVVDGNIYYQTMGIAPHRQLVVQWTGVRRYVSAGTNLATFQAVLFENGMIRVAIKTLGELSGRSATMGIEDRTETKGVTYGCDDARLFGDEQAVVFVPPNMAVGTAQAQLQFQATVGEASGADGMGEGMAVNQPVTNTVYMTVAGQSIVRQATTIVNPLDLSRSTFTSDRAEAVPNDVVVYTVTLQNSGLIAANTATLQVQLPTALTYEADTLTCDFGTCQPGADGTIAWTGPVTPGLPVAVTFAARLTQGLRDRTPLTTTATVADGHGTTQTFVATLLARRSDLSQSRFIFLPQFGEPGYKVIVMGVVQNIGGLATTGAVTMTLPPALLYMEDSLVCGTGTCAITAGADAKLVRWQGRIGSRQLVPIQLTVQIPSTAGYGDKFSAGFVLNDVDWDETKEAEATLTVAHTVLLPTIAGAFEENLLYIPLIVQD